MGGLFSPHCTRHYWITEVFSKYYDSTNRDRSRQRVHQFIIPHSYIRLSSNPSVFSKYYDLTNRDRSRQRVRQFIILQSYIRLSSNA